MRYLSGGGAYTRDPLPLRGRDHGRWGDCGRRSGGERPIRRSVGSTLPRGCGVRRSQMGYCFTITSGRGGFPRTPEQHSARRKGGRPTWSVPGSPSGSRRARLPVCAHRIQSLRGDAEQPGGQPVGERAIHRLEAALEPPSRAGIAGPGATRGGGAGDAQTRTAPNPQQSLGLMGRSQPRPSDPSGLSRPMSDPPDHACKSLRRLGGAHVRSAMVRIGTPCRLRGRMRS